MIINRDAELEKNMFSKLSDIDNIMHKKDTYALGLRLNALSSLCRALRTKEAVGALTAALDKLEADYFTGDISVDGLKSFMPKQHRKLPVPRSLEGGDEHRTSGQ